LKIYSFKFQHLNWLYIFVGLREFENRILRRIFGPKMDDNGERRRNFMVCKKLKRCNAILEREIECYF
jgi:hypothetical protein